MVADLITEAPGTEAAEAMKPRAGRWAWPAAIVAVVLLANLPALLGIVDVDPLLSWSGLGVVHGARLLVGQNAVDPNVGVTSQALGHLAAMDWLHLRVPWWNPFEGFGTPLAAGMQSAAFFPPTLLLAWSGGQLPERLLLEAVAGLATYGLLRELAMRRWVAGVGGILFALNGTFALAQHAAINPICLLPVCLLGVEWCRRYRLGSWRCLLLPIGLALSIVAGFPETAYLDAILVGCWGLLRVFQHDAGDRLRLAGRLASLGAAGIALASPLVVAFLDYLQAGTVGGRTTFEYAHLPTATLASLAVPYLTGPLKAFGRPAGADHAVSFLFTTAWGYLTIGVVTLGLFGLVRAGRELGLRLVLVGFMLVFLSRTYGVVEMERLVAHIPELRTASVFRTIFPATELSMIVLAGFGLEAALDGDRTRRWHVPVAAAIVGALVAFLALVPARTLLDDVVADGGNAESFVVGAAAWAGLVLVAIALGGAFAERRFGRILLGGALVVDAVASFVYPQLAAPRSGSVDLAPVAYLQRHLGDARYYSLLPNQQPQMTTIGGPIGPNYGSYFQVASLDYLDIPVPKAAADYVHAHLDPGPGTEFFTGTQFGRHVGSPTPVAALAANVAAFEAAGVRYLVVGSGQSAVTTVPGVHRVFDDGTVAIYELAHPASYFSASGGPCRLSWSSRTEVQATCATAALLTRRELAFPGWSVAVNGEPAALEAHPAPFSSVALPKGTSTVTFSYEPPHLALAEAAVVAAVAFLAAPFVLAAVRRRRRPRRRAHAPARSGPRRAGGALDG